jgi:HJR/Mrr/RecB family endonuclease
MRMAFAAEDTVAKFFTASGYTVERTRNKGPDLVVLADEKRIAIEVKRAIQHRGRPRLLVDGVRPARLRDDFVAIVMPDGSVFCQPMQDHLESCWPSGQRDVTMEFVAMSQRVHGAGRS